MIDKTKSCIEYEGSKIDGIPRCYPGKFPILNEKYMDSCEGMQTLVRMERNLDVIQEEMTENFESVTGKEYCHLTGFLDDGIKLSTSRTFVETAL